MTDANELHITLGANKYRGERIDRVEATLDLNDVVDRAVDEAKRLLDADIVVVDAAITTDTELSLLIYRKSDVDYWLDQRRKERGGHN